MGLDAFLREKRRIFLFQNDVRDVYFPGNTDI